VQGTYKKAGNTNTPQYYLANTGFEEKNFSYSMAYNKKWFESNFFYSQFNTTLGIFSGAHIGSLADLQTAISRTRPAVTSDFSYDIQRPFQHVEHELARLKLSANIYSLGKLNVQLGRQFNDRSEFDLLRSSQANVRKDNPQLQFKLTTHSLDAFFEHKPIAKLSGAFGGTYIRQSNVWQGRFLVPNFISNAYGIFATEKWVHRKFDAELGIRYDKKFIDVYTNEEGVVQKSVHVFSQTVASIAFAYLLREKLTLRTDFGTAWRPPTVNELYSRGLHHGAAAIENGNPTIRPEQGLKAVISLENRGPKNKSSLGFYYNHIQDFIYLKPDLVLVQTTRGAFPSFTYSQIDARFFGSDAMTDFELSKSFQLILKGGVVLAQNITQNEYLPFVPPIRYSGTIRYSPVFNQFFKKHQPYFAFSFTRVEKQHRVPDKADYMPPPPAYTLFGAEMGADIVLGKHTVIFSLEINNLFDVSYRDYMNRFRYFNDEMGRNVVFRMKIPLNFSY
jgi:iron complex outermembrane receptor protein